MPIAKLIRYPPEPCIVAIGSPKAYWRGSSTSVIVRRSMTYWYSSVVVVEPTFISTASSTTAVSKLPSTTFTCRLNESGSR